MYLDISKVILHPICDVTKVILNPMCDVTKVILHPIYDVTNSSELQVIRPNRDQKLKWRKLVKAQRIVFMISVILKMQMRY